MAINLITRRGFLSQHSASTGGDASFIMQSLSEQGRPRRSFSPSARPRCPHQVFKARDPQAQEAQEVNSKEGREDGAVSALRPLRRRAAGG